MTVLGVIACQILELEFAYLLAHDSEISGITVLEDRHASGLIDALEGYHVYPRRIPLLKGFGPNHHDRFEVLVRVMELGLHNSKRLLQEGLIKAAKDMGRYAGTILLGYGLCGNALQKPEELLVDAGVPIFIPMDENHPVDDCVGLIIGGRKCYYGEQCRVAGTFFMIPGWTRHWKEVFKKVNGGFEVEFARRFFGMSKYERSLLIPNPALPADKMRRSIEEFNRLFGLRTDMLNGSLDLLTQTWVDAKQHLMGA